jgi:hypothetical protein
MNHHFLPVNQVEKNEAKAILGWNLSGNEFFAHVYAVRGDGLLGDLLLSTTADDFFPSEVEHLEQWLEQKAVSVPKAVIRAVAEDQTKRMSSHSARYDLSGNSLDDEPLVMKGQQLMLC